MDPLISEEWGKFCSGKRAVLIVEEGQPEYIEQAACQILRQHDVNTRIVGKGPLPMFGEYSVDVLRLGLGEFLDQWAPQLRAHAGTVAARKTQVSAVAWRETGGAGAPTL